MASLVCSNDILTTGQEDLTLLDQLNHAINLATEIEISVSFIQSSGLKCLLPALEEAVERHVSIKILTSDYLYITDPIALRMLKSIMREKVDIRVFETKQRSFHMKAYIFIRQDNKQQGCAFIGSNNISKMALTTGYEWCLRYDYVAPDTTPQAQEFNKIRHSFAEIFSHPQTIELNNTWIAHYISTRKKQTHILSLSAGLSSTPLVPNCAQAEALQALHLSREQGYKKGLVVLATGMGKTWLSAFDAQAMQASRILFVAHREEILQQSLQTFACIAPEKTSGFYAGQRKDSEAEMLFASIFTLGKKKHYSKFSPHHFDYIVIDEFHHASAPSYQHILNYFKPKFLLGLTATPERSDQADILALCANNLVFERNLVHGINEKILCPFHYYGIWDEFVDYSQIPWRNGQFDPDALTNQFATRKRAEHIFSTWQKHKQTRTLAFCVSKRHADYMAQFFNRKKIRSVAVYSGSKTNRSQALTLLDKGKIDIIFSINLFNEGTDIPNLDCILMLRPTESKIVFLQQLGRGLRTAPGKTHLTVIDFIGNHRSFLNKDNVLKPSFTTREGTEKPITPCKLPPECYINIDLKLTDFWEKLKRKIGKTAVEDFNELYEKLGHRPTLTEFFNAGFDIKKVNKQQGNWFNLVASQQDDPLLEECAHTYSTFLFESVQMTSMSKCFKMILLEVFIALDGFRVPITLERLAEKSWYLLADYPYLQATELPAKESQMQAKDKSWLTYWKRNPIQALTKETRTKKAWFKIENNEFLPCFTVQDSHIDTLTDMMQELINYKLAVYANRESVKKKKRQYENNLSTYLPVETNFKMVAEESEEYKS